MKKVIVLGSINMDMVITTPYIPQSGETLTGSNFFLNPGGKGANQAVAAAKQNVETMMIACVGKDAFGNDLLDKLNNKYKVNCKYIHQIENVPTGVAMIIVCNHDNRIILDAGTNHKITKEYVDEALQEALPGDIFVSQLENNLDAIYYGFKKAKEKGLTTIFNPAPAIELDKELFKSVDYLVLNETEFEIISKIKPTSKENYKACYEMLNVKGLIITLGSKGSIFVDKNRMVEIKAHKIQAVDTTAAGDTYVGVFASLLAKDIDVIKALEYASAASALTCLKEGAQQSIPYEQDVLDFLKKG